MNLKWKKILIKTGITILVIGVMITLICIPVMMKDQILAKENAKKANNAKVQLVIKDAKLK